MSPPDTPSGEPSRTVCRFHRPVYAAFATLLIYSIIIVLRLQQFDFNPSSFVVAGAKGVLREYLPESFAVLGGSNGYDGQYFYGLAVSPFKPDAVSTGISGIGPYRHQRILYPLIVWILSLGNRQYVPHLMIAVNLAGICLVSLLSGIFFRLHGKSPLWGIIVSLYPGYVLTLSRDLSEIIAASLVLAALIAWLKARPALFSLALSLAVMTRETALIPALGGILSLIFGGGFVPARRVRCFMSLLVPFGVYLAWQLALWLGYGSAPFMTAGGLIGVPMAAFLDRILTAIGRLGLNDLLVLADSLFILAFIFTAIFCLEDEQALRPLKICLIISGVMLFSLGREVWQENFGYYRAASELFLFGYLIVFCAAGSARMIAALVSLLFWLACAARQVYFL